MKKLLLCLLSLALLFSCFALTSCEREVEDIDGLTVEEAYDKALRSLDEVDRYKVDLSMKVKVFGISVYNIRDFYFYEYDGDNGHFGSNPKAIEKMERLDLLDAGDMDEMWFYDGMCYVKEGSGDKYYFEEEMDDDNRSDYEKAVDEVIEKWAKDAKCYKDKKGYYVQIVLEAGDTLMLDDLDPQEEVYTIHFDEDGYITEIEVKAKVFGVFTLFYNVEYSYDDAPEVTLPDDAEEFEYWD